MHADLSTLFATGIAAVAAGLAALFLLVRYDLTAPSWLSARLTGGGRLFLGAALGLGVIAFIVKLIILGVLAGAPESTVALLAGGHPAAPDGDPPEVSALPGRPAEWRALPDRAPEPPDNPTTPDKVALGRRLFFDPALSADGTVACASCHDVERLAGADARPTARGIGGQTGARNAPTVWNAAFQSVQFWDGRAASLEDQALGPLVNPLEMGMPSLSAVVARVDADPTYRPLFERAFGPGIAVDAMTIARAIAAYERTLITPDAPYDRFVKGDESALTQQQKRGMWLFQDSGCAVCHSGPAFSGASVFPPRAPYRILAAAGTPEDGRYALSADKGRAPSGGSDGLWRVPSLRNVALTGPYFHNGAVADLREAVRVMAVTQVKAVVDDDPRAGQRFVWSPETGSLDMVQRRRLSNRDVDDIVAFLDALTGDTLGRRTGGADRGGTDGGGTDGGGTDGGDRGLR